MSGAIVSGVRGELLAIVDDDLHAHGRHFRTLDGIVLDTSDDMSGELIFTVFAATAKFRRQQIVKGTREGLDAASARGPGRGQAAAAERRAGYRLGLEITYELAAKVRGRPWSPPGQMTAGSR